MGTAIIKNWQFNQKFFFTKLTNPKGETTLKQPQVGNISVLS